MDIVHLVGREPTLNTVCCRMKLMVTLELAKRTSAEVWQAFFFEWVLRFLGPPKHFVVDAAREFISKEFRDNCSSIGIEIL